MAQHHPAAFINAIAEEGTKAEAVKFLQEQWDENCELRAAVRALYYAAHWYPDRQVDAVALWTAVRDAAGIKPGKTSEVLGEPRGPVAG